MPRLQDMLFVVLGVAIVALLALHLRVALFALVGAFACGSIYVFAAMIPPRNEAFGRRLFTSVFLSSVMSCLVLILPATVGVNRLEVQTTIVAIAALLPCIAVCFEIVRTPRVTETILRTLRRR